MPSYANPQSSPSGTSTRAYPESQDTLPDALESPQETDPVSNMMIRSVPRSVRLQLGSQAKARGLTLAQYLAQLVKQQENAK